MKRLYSAIDRSLAAHGWDATVRAASALAGDRFATTRPIGQGVTMNAGVPGRGSA